MEAPATLEGGDVLRVADRLFVGLSRRTNERGAAALARVAVTVGVVVETVAVPAGLHLKSVCSLADEHTLVYDTGARLDLAALRRAGLTCVAAPEPRGANVLALGGGRVLVSAAAPRTVALLRARGLSPVVVDVGEMHRADGALTCLSVRIPAPGAWCT
jgi:dimethylargininase